MRADRPLTEHEGALFDAVCILARTVLDLGADPKVLNERLGEARKNAEALGNASIRNVYGVDFREDFDGALVVAHLLVGRAEVVAHRLILVLRVAGRL